MSIASEIERISSAKEDLKAAINAKGGTLTTELLGDYAAAVAALPVGSGGSEVDTNAVHIYAATVSSDGTVTITTPGSPPVSALALGDQILADDALYRKATYSAVITTEQTVTSGIDASIILFQQSNNGATPGAYVVSDPTATGTDRVWVREANFSTYPDNYHCRIIYNPTSSRWETQNIDAGNQVIATGTGNADPTLCTWDGGSGATVTAAYRQIDSTSVITATGAGTGECNGDFLRITPASYDLTSGDMPLWYNFDTGSRLYCYYEMAIYNWTITEPSSGDPAYQATDGIDPVECNWSASVWGSAPPPTLVYGANTIIDQITVEDNIACFAKIAELNASGANTVIDVIMDLDWDNSLTIPAANTVYQASRAGVAVIRAQSGEAGVFCSPTAVTPGGEISTPLLGSVAKISDGNVAGWTLVPKGCYYFTHEQNLPTVIHRTFIPFKNSSDGSSS